jgi:hypothetical protein
LYLAHALHLLTRFLECNQQITQGRFSYSSKALFWRERGFFVEYMHILLMITPQKRVLIGILIIGIITATITRLAVTNVLSLAAAQIQVPFQTQPRLPQQQQPSATTTTSSTSSGSFGPGCVGCVTTQNLANGAVTNPKLAVPSVSSANIGTGQVATGNIANGAVTTTKIASGAVSITTESDP